jgi:hypothetical protein
MSNVIVCPNAMEHATLSHLMARGFAISNVRGRKRLLTVAHRPVRNVVQMPRRSVVDEMFRWLEAEQ